MSDAKTELRRAMRERRLGVPPAEAARAAERAATHLLALPELAAAKTVGIYAAVRGELSTAAVDRGLRARGVTIGYPVVPADRTARTLTFRVASPAELTPGAWDLPEPPADARALDLAALDALILPGLAFDRTGARLGWGGAYYDTTLAAATHALRLGFAHAFQVVPRVPETQGDERVDVIVTELGARRTARGEGQPQSGGGSIGVAERGTLPPDKDRP